jgi:hypothetical protein
LTDVTEGNDELRQDDRGADSSMVAERPPWPFISLNLDLRTTAVSRKSTQAALEFQKSKLMPTDALLCCTYAHTYLIALFWQRKITIAASTPRPTQIKQTRVSIPAVFKHT